MPIIGPTGTFGNPIYAGNADVLRRVFAPGIASRVAWIGDSIANVLHLGFLRACQIPLAGYFVDPQTFTFTTDYFTNTLTGFGGQFGGYAAGSLGGVYSLKGAQETVFTTNARSTFPVGGAPVTLENRITSQGTLLTAATRILTANGIDDWLPAGASANARMLIYKNSTGSNAIVRPYVRGSGSSSAYRGSISPINCFSASPAYAAFDIPFTPVGSEDIIIETQASADGDAIQNGKNVAQLGTLITNAGVTGMTMIDLGLAGSSIDDWTDATCIAPSAFNGMLPLLNPTTVIISLIQNGGPWTTAAYVALKTLIRTAMPDIDIIWLATHSTSVTPGVAGTAEENAALMYAAADLTEDAWLSLCDSAMTQPQMIANNLIDSGDGVHPNIAGSTYLGEQICDLSMRLMGDAVASNVRGGVAYSVDGTGTGVIVEGILDVNVVKVNGAAVEAVDSVGDAEEASVQKAIRILQSQDNG